MASKMEMMAFLTFPPVFYSRQMMKLSLKIVQSQNHTDKIGLMLIIFIKASVEFPKCSHQIDSSSVESLLADLIIFNDYIRDRVLFLQRNRTPTACSAKPRR